MKRLTMLFSVLLVLGMLYGCLRDTRSHVLDAAFGGVLEPEGGALGDVEFAVRVVGLAVAAGLVVGAAPVHGAVVLRDVEIDGPGRSASVMVL